MDEPTSGLAPSTALDIAKNQITAGAITTPALLTLMMIPMFSGINDVPGKISSFLFMGVMVQAVGDMAAGAMKIVVLSCAANHRYPVVGTFCVWCYSD